MITDDTSILFIEVPFCTKPESLEYLTLFTSTEHSMETHVENKAKDT